MSTQRRENCPTPATKINRCGPNPTPFALYRRAFAAVAMAPNWVVTNSLQSDHSCLNFVMPAWFAKQDIRRGLMPSGAGFRAASGTLTTRRLSLPFIPSPSGFKKLHSTLPQFPALKSRWTERYDGKRDLHFQHAA
jgi:hypothetical protein